LPPTIYACNKIKGHPLRLGDSDLGWTTLSSNQVPLALPSYPHELPHEYIREPKRNVTFRQNLGLNIFIVASAGWHILREISGAA